MGVELRFGALFLCGVEALSDEREQPHAVAARGVKVSGGAA